MGVLRPEFGKPDRLTRKTAQKSSRTTLKPRFSRKIGAKQILLLGFLETEISEKYEAELNRAIINPLRLHTDRMKQAFGERWSFDADEQALTALRKSIRMISQARPLVEKMFRQGKPSGLTQLIRAVGNNLENCEEEWNADGERLQKAFQAIVPQLDDLLSKATRTLLYDIRSEYSNTLNNLL